MPDEHIDRLIMSDIELNEELSRGLYYAKKLFGREVVIDAQTPEDVVSEAYLRICTGTRKGPTFQCALFWAIRSIISTARGRDHLLTQAVQDLSTSHDVPNAALFGMEQVDRHGERGRQIEQQLRDLFEEDLDASLVLECFLSNLFKAEAIATELGWPVTKVYTVTRRMRRTAQSTMQEPHSLEQER